MRNSEAPRRSSVLEVRTSIREDRTSFLSDENRQSAIRFRSRTRSSSAEEVEALPFARELGLTQDGDDVDPGDHLPETRPGEIPIRRLSFPVMQWLHAQGLLMTGWEKYPHIFLDFSDDLFSLCSMQPLDFRWRRKEGEEKNPGARMRNKAQEQELIVGKLKTLKLDNNKLRDADFDPAKDVGIASSAFASLRSLSLSKNLLVYPIIMLPRLKELDLSHNRLIQVPPLSGLGGLETLNLSHNKIEDLDPKSFRDGRASNLRSLDLRFNRLQVFPQDLHRVFDEFARSSQMHTLRLSQNPFCCLFPEYHMLAALSMPRLRRLDKVLLTGQWRSEMLRYGRNFFGMAVSNYVTGDGKLLETVNSVRSFPDDSTTEPLPEVNRLLQLKLGVEASSLDKARAFFLQDRVEMLSSEVKDRERIADYGGLGVGVSRKTINRSRVAQTEQETPLLSSMVQEFDSAIAGHTLIANSCIIVFQKASQLSGMAADKVEFMFDDIKVKTNIKTGKMDPHLLRAAREDLSKTFAEQICMLAERHAGLRSILIRTLAKCGSIPNEIGPPCLNSLALLAQADDETRQAVLDVVQEIILPAMQDGQIVEDSTGQLYQAVANMNCEGMEDILESAIPEISAAVKSILRSGVNSKMLAKMQRSCEAAIKLLEIAVRSEAAALKVIKEDVLKAIVEYLSIDSVFLDKSACWIFVSGVHVLLGCLEHHRKKALASLSSAGLSTHLELLQNMEELGKSKETPGPALCRKAGSTMELLASLAQEDDILEELMAYGKVRSIEDNPFVRVALGAAPCAATADPVQLAGSMKCLVTMLYNERQRNRFGKFIVESLELMDKKKNKIWGYIDGTYFREVSRSCEMYSKHEENAKDPAHGFGTADLINFVGVTDPNRIRNSFMHNMLVSVIDFLKAFSALADGDSKELCTRVSQVFNEMGRESVLFKLLQVPSTDVQEAVMGCLQYARLEELDDEEVQQLLHMLNPEIVESGERLLGAVLRNLTQFLEKDGEAADRFRRNHTRSVIDRTFKVLSTNSARETFGNPAEEEQKITLSEQCVQVLIAASFQPLLRRHLRGEVAKDFLKMLKDHENLDSWNCRDMNLELTWTGRHLDLLLSCLNTASPMCLRNDMKQAFRVFHRIANVMAGVGDTPDMARTAEERAAEETVMWNEKLMRQEANLLDDVAYDDQLQQQLIFFSFSGIERLVHFLEMPPEDGQEHLEETSPKNNKKSDRSVAVELQQQARSYLEELLADVTGSNEALRQHTSKSAEREEPETVEMGDVEILHPGAVGDQLLREVFAQEGWHSLSAPEEEDAELGDDSGKMQGDEVVPLPRAPGGIATLLEDLFARGQQSFWTPDVCPVALPQVPKRLQRTNTFFIPGTSLVNSSFFVSALLRTIFAALTLPTTESVSSLVNFRLRNPTMQLRLIALLEKSGSYLDCHLAAKLMRILSMVLRLHPDQSTLQPEENDWQHCIGLVIAAGLAGRVLKLLEPLLKHLGRGFELEFSHLVLAREAVRLVQTITSTVSRIHFSDTLDIQKHALEVMVLDLIPMPTMKVIVMILLYDMQVAANVHGSKDAALRIIRWQDLHGLCSETLAQLMHLAPSIRYEAMELMNRQQVLHHKQLHTSFISDLLDRSENHRLVRAFDLLLPELEGYQSNEKVLQLAWAEMPEEGAKSMFSVVLGFTRTGGARLVALTTHRLVILGQSRHGAAKRPCGLCPPESFCPIGPEIYLSYSFGDLTRIYSSDAQLLILGRCTVGRQGPSEKFDIFIFHQVDAQREFKERLMVLSGLNPLMRIKLHQEMLVNKAAKSKTASRIARTTWGFRQTDEGERLSLFLLTELNFFEFQPNFGLWIPNSVTEEKAYGSDNDYEGGESDDEAQEFTKASDFAKATAKAAKDARAAKFLHERREQEEPTLAERQSERQARRFQDPPNKWLLDGINTGEKAAFETLWKHLSEAQINQIKKDRSQAMEATEQELFEVPGASREKEIKHMHQVMKEKRKAILSQLFKCPIRNLKSVSFDPGSIPILQLNFQPDQGPEEQVEIRFLDDCARESWRRNLQLVLQKTFTDGAQWGRTHEDHLAADARAAVKSNRAARFFAHDA